MNAADRAQLAELFTLQARLADVPLPVIDESLTGLKYVAASEKADRERQQLMDVRLIQIEGNMKWLAGQIAGGEDLGRAIKVIIEKTARDVAEPLPYPARQPAGVPS